MAVSRTDLIVSLPQPLTSLIGRSQELDHLYDLLRSDVALVTVTGFGGVGKTRLALQAALELEPVFDAGAIFAPLAAVTRGSSIPRAIALTAGLDESIDTVEALAEALGPQSRLLVLDNLEQIPDAAMVVLQLLTTMPNLTILATSRSRLELSGEHVLPLEPFDSNAEISPHALRQLPAVQLFLERARAAAPSMPTDDNAVRVIGEICQRLDGIPLAIELAAARLIIFSLTDLRDQLDHQLPVLASNRVDMPDRQKTMRNAIAWTYELLEASERRLFTWLSIYEQDFSLDSVRHVTHQLELTEEPLDLVQFLVTRSLIRPSRQKSETPRYQMLQMLREFGHEQLLATNDDAIARRSHAMDMVALSERAEPHFLASSGKRWMLKLGDDVPNILGAMHWALANNLPDVPLRIVGSAWRFAKKSGVSRQFLANVPSIKDTSADIQTRARALVGIGNLHEVLSHIDLAEDAFSNALSLTTQFPHGTTRVAALAGMGLTALSKGDMKQMDLYATQAHELAVEISDDTGRDYAAGLIAMLKIQTGKSDEAIPILTELVANAALRGDTGSEASFSGNLGVALQIEDRYEESKQYILRAIQLAEESANLYSAAIGYVNLTSACLLLKDFDNVMTYGEKGLATARKAGQVASEVSLLTNIACVHIEQEKFATAAQNLAYAVNLIDSDGSIAQQVQFPGVYVDICLGLDMRAEAAELLGAVRAMRESLDLEAYPWQAEGENEAYERLDPEHNPDIEARMERGAMLDRKGLVARMNEITALIVSTCPPDAPAQEPVMQPAYHLTPRETEVLGMLATGLTNAEIADAMFVSTRTVTTHLTNIFTKLQVSNRSRAVAVAMNAGLV